MSNDVYTHYVVLNETILGKPASSRNATSGSLACICKTRGGGPKPFSDYAFVENRALVPQSPELNHISTPTTETNPPTVHPPEYDGRRVLPPPVVLPPHSHDRNRMELTKLTKLNVEDCECCEFEVAVLPEPNFPVKPDEFIGRQVHLDTFADSLQSSSSTGRMASFAILGDWGIGKSSLLLKLASTCSNSTPRMLPVTFSISKDISDYLRFAEALCDPLAGTLLASDSLATKIRAEIDNWKETKVSVGASTSDRQNRRYFLSSGSALLRHALFEAWEHFIRPAYAGAILFLDDLHNLATPTAQDTALIIRDQFQSFGIDGINLSVCFTAKRDYFSGIRSFAEPVIRFYNKCVLELFTAQETAEYTHAVFGGADLDPHTLVEWLFSKTLGHPYFLAFISRELWSNHQTRPFANATQLWPIVFSRLEEGKFNNDLAQLSEKEVGLLRAIARDDHEESIPAPFAQNFPHIYFKRLADKGLLIRAGRGRYKLYHPLFRQFLQQRK